MSNQNTSNNMENLNDPNLNMTPKSKFAAEREKLKMIGERGNFKYLKQSINNINENSMNIQDGAKPNEDFKDNDDCKKLDNKDASQETNSNEPEAKSAEQASRRSAFVFVKFVGDILSHALKQYGLEWKLDYKLPLIGSVFKPEFGDVVLACQHLHSSYFRQCLYDYPGAILDDNEAFFKYINKFSEANFNNDVFLMEMLKLFAFLVDLAIYCYENDRIHLIADCALSMEVVYLDNFGSPFRTVGGYTALFKFGEQYIEYQNTSRKTEE